MPDTVTDTATDDSSPEIIADHLEAARAAFNSDPEPQTSDDPKPSEDSKTSNDLKSSIADSFLKKGDDNKSDPKDDVVDVKDIDDVKDNDWKALKSIAKEERTAKAELSKKVSEYEAQLAELKKTRETDEVSTARIRELEEREKMLSDRLKASDIKSHPEFEEKYLKPAEDALNRAKAILEGDEVEGIDLDELMSLKGREFNRALDGVTDKMSRLAGTRFVAAVDAALEARTSAEEAVKNSDQFLLKANERMASQQRAAFDIAAKQFEAGLEAQQIPEDADDATKSALLQYNDALAGITDAAAKAAFSSTSNEEIAQMALNAELAKFAIEHAIPRIASIADVEIAKRDTRVAELEAEVKRLTEADPGYKGGGGDGDGPPKAESHLGAAKKYQWGS